MPNEFADIMYGKDAFLAPVSGELISDYGDSRSGGGRVHHAGDIRAEPGTPVIAPTTLRVKSPFPGRGESVNNMKVGDWGVDLEDQEGRTYKFVHMGNTSNLQPGQVIPRGQAFGTVGNVVSHPHLHFALKDESGNPVDWMSMAGIKRGGNIGDTIDWMKKDIQRQQGGGKQEANEFAEFMVPPPSYAPGQEPKPSPHSDNVFSDVLKGGKPAPTFEGKITKEAPAPNIYEGRIDQRQAGAIPPEVPLIPPQGETQDILAQMQGLGKPPQTPAGEPWPGAPPPPNPQLPGYAEMRAPQPGRQMGQPEFTNVPPPQMRAATQADIEFLAPQDTLSQLNRVAANAFKAPADVVHGFATAIEMASEAATGQRSHILTNVTGKAREMLSPKELLDDSSTLEKYTGQLMGGLASYMMPGAALKAAGVALPMETVMQKFGSNLLTFAETDVARTIGQGGSVDDAKKAAMKSIPMAALFTVAQALPFDKVTESPYLTRALESAATGTAFAGTSAAEGERDPYQLAVNFFTGFGLHALTSGKPRMTEEQSAKVQKKEVDDFFKDFKVDWEKTNEVTPKEKKAVDEVMKTVEENVKRVPPERQQSEAPTAVAPETETPKGGVGGYSKKEIDKILLAGEKDPLFIESFQKESETWDTDAKAIKGLAKFGERADAILKSPTTQPLPEGGGGEPLPVEEKPEPTKIPVVKSAQSANKAVRVIDDLLLRRAKEKAQAENDDHNLTIISGIKPTGKSKFLTTADRNYLNMYLFGDTEGRPAEELLKKPEPKPPDLQKPGAGEAFQTTDIEGNPVEQEFIRELTKAEAKNPSSINNMSKIPTREGWDVVYKPAGEKGKGYYYTREIKPENQPQPEPAGKAEGETKQPYELGSGGPATTPIIKGLANRAVESGKEAHTMVQQATRILKANLASDSLSETARKASEMVMGNAAARDTEVKRMTYEMRGFKDYAGPIDGERTLTFAKQYQSGQPVTDPVMKALGDTYRQEERRQMETMRDLGKSPADLANYLDQLWDLTPEQKDKFVSTILGTRPRTVQGPKYFFKQRIIPDIPSGIAAGLKPRYDNLVDMMLAGRTAREKFIEGQRNIQGLRDNGWLKNVRSPKDVPEGWVILPDPFGTIYTKESRPGGLMVPHEADEQTMPLGGGPERMAYDEVPKFSGFVLRGFRAVPEDVATVFKNYLGRGLEGNPLNTAIQKPIHAIRMSQVALSAAHLSIEGFNAMSVGTMADMGDLLGGMIAGDATRFKRGALGMAAKPIPFFDLIRMANRGRKLTIAGLKPEYATPENVAMLKQLQAGGTRIEPQYKFWSEMMGGHLKDALGAMQEFRPFKAGMSTLRALSSGIMDFVVPFTKLGANERIYLREVDRFTAKNGRPPTAEESQSLAYDAQKFADNMFGKMVADNLGMNRTIKSLLSSVIQFPTWNVGSVKWGAGNIRFGAKTLKQAADLLMGNPVKPMDAQARLAVQYTAGLLFSVGLIGGMTNYLMTGEPPKELLDFYYPRSGAKRPDGSAERIQFLTYLKDVVGMRKHPAKTVWAKTAAPLHMLNDLINNRDYWGNYIVDPDEESPFKKTWDVLKYGVGSAKPFSLQGWQASEKRTPGMAVLNVFGARPTPKWLLQTPAEEKIAQYQEGKTRKAMTPEEAAISKSKYDAIKDFREGKVKDANDKIDALIADGKMSESKVKPWLSREGIHFVKEGDKTILKVDHPKVVAFKYLDIKQALEAYRVSNKEEKKLYAPVLKKKINDLKDDEYDRLKPKINKALGIEEKKDETEQDFGKPRRKANG